MNEDLNLALSICSMQRALLRALNNDRDDEDVSWTDYCILRSVSEHPGISVQQLAGAVSLSSGSITYSLDKLESGGYLARRRKATDGRSSIVFLTETGHSFESTLSQQLTSVSSHMFRDIIGDRKSCALGVMLEALERSKDGGNAGKSRKRKP